MNMEQKFQQFFNASFVAYQLIYLYLFTGFFCVWDVKIIPLLLFYEVWLLSTTKMKMEGRKKKNHPDLQILQTVSTKSDYVSVWWSQIINQNLLRCMCT